MEQSTTTAAGWRIFPSHDYGERRVRLRLNAARIQATWPDSSPLVDEGGPMCRVPARSATAQWLLRRHEALQFLVEVLHDDELRSRGRLVRAAARLDHQKPLAAGHRRVPARLPRAIRLPRTRIPITTTR